MSQPIKVTEELYLGIYYLAENLRNESFLGFYELVQKCKREDFPLTRNEHLNVPNTLRKYSLMKADGRIPEVVRTVVLASIRGEGLSVRLMSLLSQNPEK